ncbi:MAG: DUF1499 domain-containing protein [Gammaproteobacteria bacterium]
MGELALKWWILMLSLPVALLAGALLLNRPPWFEPPGPLARLRLYLTTNVAETRVDHARPELRPLVLALPEPDARARVEAAMRTLGWRNVRRTGEALTAEVVTPLLRFVDDVAVRLEPGADGILVQVRSASRLGRGDLAANTRHVLDLYAALR